MGEGCEIQLSFGENHPAKKQHLFLGMASPTKKAAIHYNDDNGDVNEDDFEREGIENE